VVAGRRVPCEGEQITLPESLCTKIALEMLSTEMLAGLAKLHALRHLNDGELARVPVRARAKYIGWLVDGAEHYKPRAAVAARVEGAPADEEQAAADVLAGEAKPPPAPHTTSVDAGAGSGGLVKWGRGRPKSGEDGEAERAAQARKLGPTALQQQAGKLTAKVQKFNAAAGERGGAATLFVSLPGRLAMHKAEGETFSV